MSRQLVGLPASPGVGLGPAWWYRRPRLEIPRTTGEDPEAERGRLDAARQVAKTDLEALIESLRGRLSPKEAAIFEAQVMMLDDPELQGQVTRSLADGASAEAAWWAAVQDFAARLEALPGEVFKARAADVRDIGQRVLRRLLGADEAPGIPHEQVVVLAQELTPSDTVALDADRVVAICAAGGGPTSHAAILARRLGVPAVVGVGDDLLSVEAGVSLLVDGEGGTVVVDPDETARAAARLRQVERRADQAAAEAVAHEPAVTRDGARVEVAANAGSLADAEAAVRYGADGIGLLRTEFLYLDRAAEPDEDEQAVAYRAIIASLRGRPVVIRTLDIGGDKPVPYIPLPAQSNPFLGVRAIRLAARDPGILPRQLRAILRAGAGYPVRIMFPMVATIAEMRSLRAAVDEARRELLQKGAAVTIDLQVGMMVEVPSAALLAERFVPWTDFFSIGTNDLAQYVLAADRTNAAVAALADGLHPAVLRLIRMVTAAAAGTGRWVGVCGELAGDEAAVPVLMGLGVVELSMNPPAVPVIKKAIRQWVLSRARELAARALDLDSAQAVREMVRLAVGETTRS